MDEVQTLPRTKLQRPPLWTCVFFNDDETPMIFVIEVLMEIFHQTREIAEETTMKIHTEGRAAVGVYPKDVARMKADQTLAVAASRRYPLRVSPEAI